MRRFVEIAGNRRLGVWRAGAIGQLIAAKAAVEGRRQPLAPRAGWRAPRRRAGRTFSRAIRRRRRPRRGLAERQRAEEFREARRSAAHRAAAAPPAAWRRGASGTLGAPAWFRSRFCDSRLFRFGLVGRRSAGSGARRAAGRVGRRRTGNRKDPARPPVARPKAGRGAPPPTASARPVAPKSSLDAPHG